MRNKNNQMHTHIGETRSCGGIETKQDSMAEMQTDRSNVIRY